MFGFLLFLHLFGMAVWLGSLVAIGIMLLLLKPQLGTEAGNGLLRKTVKAFNILTHPSAFVVLASGGFMIMKLGLGDGDKPFWMVYMERGGGMVILLSIIGLSLLGRRLLKKLASSNTAVVHDAGGARPAASVSRFAASMFVTAILVVSVVFVVSAKL